MRALVTSAIGVQHFLQPCVAAVPFVLHRWGVMPVVLGGDHSIGFPTIRGLAPHVEIP